MKVNVDVDLTPDEARKLMGMPDLEPMQQAIMKKVQDKISEEIDNITDIDNLYKRYLPLGMSGIEQMQKFFTGMTSVATSGSGETTPKRSKK